MIEQAIITDRRELGRVVSLSGFVLESVTAAAAAARGSARPAPAAPAPAARQSATPAPGPGASQGPDVSWN